MELQDKVSFEDFLKVDLRVGRVLSATPFAESEKLLELKVDFGEVQKTILAGLKLFYPPEFFTDKCFIFVYNLASRKMASRISEGMLLCVDGEKPLPVEAPSGSIAGDIIK